jgi:hypothetical protein
MPINEPGGFVEFMNAIASGLKESLKPHESSTMVFLREGLRLELRWGCVRL